MKKVVNGYIHLTSQCEVKRINFGARARRLFLLKSMSMPVPRAVLLSIDAVRKIQTGKKIDTPRES